MNNLTHLLVLLIFVTTGAFSQEKYEKEYRIKTEVVPQGALEFIKSVGFSKKVKWYKEEGLTRNTIEAKTKHRGAKYSIEFNIAGEIEDVEYVIKWNDIPSLTRLNIDTFLDSIYQKMRLVKIQIQLTGNKEELLKALVKPEANLSVITKYEIVLKGKSDSRYELLEYLFSENGQMERKSKITLKNTDNLEY